MMHPFPFFGGSIFRRPYHYYSYPKPSHNASKNFVSDTQNPYFPSIPSKKEQGNFDCFSNSSENKNCNVNNIEDTRNNSDECFEIFGLKLYFDDLLIIALLFFLYQEDVKDSYLYIALILLLLS